jgi:hypothetical protein
VAQVTRTASKAKFQNGDIPTENDFIDLHDSVTWYDEGGGLADGDYGDVVVSGTGTVFTLEDQFKRTDPLNAYNALGSAILAIPVWGGVNTITTNTSLANGVVRMCSLWLSKAATLTGVKWFQTTIGNYTGSTYNGFALYSYSGGTLTLQAQTTDDSEVWKGASGSWQTKAFASTYSAAAGLYYIMPFYNRSAETVAPAIGHSTAMQTANVSSFDFTNSAKITGQINVTTPPSTQAMTGVFAIATQPWVAIY